MAQYGHFRRVKAIQVCEGGFLRCVIKEDIGLTWEFTFSGGNSKCILTNCNVLEVFLFFGVNFLIQIDFHLQLINICILHVVQRKGEMIDMIFLFSKAPRDHPDQVDK